MDQELIIPYPLISDSMRTWREVRIFASQKFCLAPNADRDNQNTFIEVSRIQTFGKSCTLQIIQLLSSVASFQPLVS